MRLIGADGEQVGIISTNEAKKQAQSSGLDLMLISAEANPPVCKLVNFGQFKYEQQKKEKKAKKMNKNQVLKELKLSVKISQHDYMVRVNRGKEFLSKGNTIKVSVYFKGREVTRKSFGLEVLERFIKDIEDFGTPSSKIIDSSRISYIMIVPKQA